MDSTQLCSFLLTILTGPVLLFPGRSLALVPVTEESYRQAVLPPFLNGLNSLKAVAETLQTSTDLLQEIPNNVGQLLESSYKSLSEAEQASLAQVRALSANVEERLSKIKTLNDEQKVLESRQQGLNEQLSGLQQQESLARQQLQAAQRAVDNAHNALMRIIQRNNDLNTAIYFIPFLGPIAAAALGATTYDAKQEAEKALEGTKQYLNTQIDAVNTYVSQAQSYREVISSTEQNIAVNIAEIKAIQEALTWESWLQQKLTDFLVPVRKCTAFLSSMAGEARVANMLKELSDTLDALLPVLNNIVVTVRPLVGSSSEYQLLITATLPTIIAKLEEANSRVKEAAASKIRVL